MGAGGVVTPFVRCTSLPQVCWLMPWNCSWAHASEPYQASRARVAAKKVWATLCAASDASKPRLAWHTLGPPRVRRLPARRKLRLSVPLKTPIPWSWVVLSSRGCGTAMLSSRTALGLVMKVPHPRSTRPSWSVSPTSIRMQYRLAFSSSVKGLTS